MQNKRFSTKLFSVLLLLSAFSWSTAVSCHAASDLNRNGNHLKSVSMIELIANPEKFDGKRVFVSGFVHFEFEGNGLYLHDEDFVDNIWKNGIGLSVTPEQEKRYAVCDAKYCFVVGTFHAVKPGYSSLWSGHLSDVTAMQILATSANKSGSSPTPLSPAQAHKA